MKREDRGRRERVKNLLENLSIQNIVPNVLINMQTTGSSLLVHATHPPGTKLSTLWHLKMAVVLSLQMQRDRVTTNLVQPAGVCVWGGENQILPPILEDVSQSSLWYIAFQW